MARRRDVGFIYQFHHLLPEFSAAENVMLPQMADGVAKAAAMARAEALLSRVGLSERASHRPAELSGGAFDRLIELVRETGLSAVIATHNAELAKRMDRVVRLDAGRLAPA